MRRPGFEPGVGARQAVDICSQCQPIINYKAIKSEFEKWLLKRVDRETANKYVRYLDRYLDGAIISDVKDLVKVCDRVSTGWNWFAKAVRNLVNYCIDKRLISKSWGIELKDVLKLKKTGFDTYVPSDEQVKQTLAKCKRQEMRLVMKLVYYSGIRVREALKILNDFDKDKLHIIDEIAYYDIDWERGNKKAFKAFMPAHLAKQLKQIEITEYAVCDYFRRMGLPLKYGRNWFIDKMVKAGVQESLIKFMIGHSNGSVLMTNYLEKLNNSIHAYRKALPLLQSVLEQ